MRIAFLSWPLTVAGGHRVILRQAEGLAAAGHEVEILVVEGTKARPPPSKVPITNIARRPNLDGTGSELVLSGSSVRGALLTSRRVGTYDVVIATWLATLATARAVARRTGACPVWLLQDFPAMFRSRRVLSMLKRGPQSVRGVIADSQFLLDHAVQMPADVPGHVVPPGLDDAFLTPGVKEVAPWDGERPVRLVWVGTPAPYKGFAAFIEVLQALRRAGVPAEGTAVGPPTLGAQAVDGLRILSGMDDNTFREEVTRADVVVSTATQEGFGYPPLEGMALGTPAVLVDSGGCREYAKAGENCFLFDRRDPEAMARAVRQIMEDGELHRRLVAAGRQTARRFRWSALQPRFVAAVESIAAASGPR